MEIKFKQYDGGGNWITADETKPYFSENELILKNGKWSISGHGVAEINSHIIVNDPDLTSIFVAYRYFGKYKGGSSYYWHFKNGIRVSFNKLSEEDKLRILDGDIPHFAKVPGKLKIDYLNNPDNPFLKTEMEGDTIIAYKYLHQDENGKFYSLRGNNFEWKDGCLDADQTITEDNTSGIYAMKHINSPGLENYKGYGRKLVKLFLSGKVLEFKHVFRAEHADIVEVLS
jgi:hypothetical protein